MSRKPLSKRTRSDAPGNFADLDALLAHLGSSPVIELGKPLPSKKYLPKRRVGRCPAAHNEALLDRSDRANSHNGHSSGASAG